MDSDNKFDKICFCCLTEEGQLKNMLDEVLLSTKIKIQFVEGYTICSGISPDTSTLKNICQNCEEKLKTSYAFRELCRASYQTLKERSSLIAEMCVDVKHEVASASENDDYVYDIFDEEVKSDPCQFNQVFVKDISDQVPAKRKKKSTTKRHSKKHALQENDPTNATPLKSEQTDDSDVSVRVKRKPKVAKRSKRKEARPEKVKRFKPEPPPAEDTAVMESTFVCYYCDAVMQTHNDFQKHRTEHMIRNSYPSINRVCNICQEDVKHYVKHILDCHKDYRPNTCHYCTAGKFQNPCDLKNHLSFHLSCEPSHECLACKEKFSKNCVLSIFSPFINFCFFLRK
jgi:Zinc-finger associated domain (zf-AD)